MYGIIYKATSPSGKVYIGQTVKTLSRRKGNHKDQSLKSYHSYHFANAIRKYGIDNFVWEQVDTADSKEELNQKEKYWIAYYNSTNPTFGYNSQNGGSNGTPSNETRKKMSEVQKGRKATAQSRRKNSEAKIGNKNWLGKHHTLETKEKIRQANIGKHHSEEVRQKISESNLGKISAMRGKFHTLEAKQKISEANKGENAPACKITKEIAIQIKIDLMSGMRICDVMKKHNTSRPIVKHIKNGTSWSWVKIGA
jgi:group I intron endonuclease